MLLEQQLHHRAAWPASAGQFGGKRRMSAVHDPRRRRGKLVSAPKGRMEGFRSEHDRHNSLPEYCIKTQYSEGSRRCASGETTWHFMHNRMINPLTSCQGREVAKSRRS